MDKSCQSLRRVALKNDMRACTMRPRETGNVHICHNRTVGTSGQAGLLQNIKLIVTYRLEVGEMIWS